MIPDTKQPGDILRASDWNAAQEQARRGVTGVIGPGMEYQEGPGGISIAPHPQTIRSELTVPAIYLSAATLVSHSVVELVIPALPVDSQSPIDCRLCAIPGTQRLGVIRDGAAQNDVVWPQHTGVCLARGYPPTDSENFENRMGVIDFGRYWLDEMPGGPVRYLATIDDAVMPNILLVEMGLGREGGIRIGCLDDPANPIVIDAKVLVISATFAPFGKDVYGGFCPI